MQFSYVFLSVEKFRENIKTAVQANIAAALLEVAPELELPVFQGYNYDRAVREAYPVLNILTVGSDSQMLDSGNYEEDKGLLLEVEQISGSGDDLIKTLEPYVLAVRTIVSSMTEEQISDGVNRETRSEFLITTGSERYGERQYESESTFVRVGSVIARINYLEGERPVSF